MSNVVDVVLKLTDMVSGKLKVIRDSMAQTSTTAKRLSNTVNVVGKNIGSIGMAMAPVASGIVAAGVAGARAFIGFDATITAAGAKAGATAEEMTRMRDTAANLGAKFPVSASAVATAMDSLAASGFNANETINVMPSILTAAVASGEDLATTSSVVTSALNVWGLKQGDVGANAAHMADVIQQAANMSSLSMTDFGIAMQYAGAPAAALNVNVEELSTALALIKNKGIDASTAGTSLRSLFTRLSAPPKAAADAIAQMGIVTKDAQGNFVGLENVISQMRKSMQGMSDTQRIALAQAVAGTEGYSALLSLVDTSAESYAKMANAMNNANGSSAKQYEIMQNTVKGSIDSMLGSIESLAINTGNVMAPSMKQAANAIASVADAINKLSPEQKKTVADTLIGVVAVTLMAVTLGKIITIVGAAIKIYSSFGTVLAGLPAKNKLVELSIKGVAGAYRLMRAAALAAIPKISAAFSLMLSPIGIAVIAIIALGYLLYRNWDTVKQLFIRITKNISDTVKVTFNALRAFAVIWIGSIINRFLNFRSMVIAVLGGLVNFISSVLAGEWQAAWQNLLNVFGVIAGQVSGIFANTINGIRSMINTLIDGFNGIQINIPTWVPGIGGQGFGPLNIPHLASGTDNWPGGTAMIHDRGAEIVDLPSGSRVIPHDKSITAAYNQGKAQSFAGISGGINVHIANVNVNGDDDIEKLARDIAARIFAQMQKRAVNLKVGAI